LCSLWLPYFPLCGLLWNNCLYSQPPLLYYSLTHQPAIAWLLPSPLYCKFRTDKSAWPTLVSQPLSYLIFRLLVTSPLKCPSFCLCFVVVFLQCCILDFCTLPLSYILSLPFLLLWVYSLSIYLIACSVFYCIYIFFCPPLKCWSAWSLSSDPFSFFFNPVADICKMHLL
jgi:hypothetical protein